jgi:hypothetical protein
MLLGGVVDQDVEPAELVDRLLHRSLAECLVAEVAGDGQGPPPFLLDNLLRRLRIVMLAQIDDGYVGAFAREQRRDRPPDPAVGTGDERDLALEPVGAAVARLPIGLGLEPAFVPRQPVLVDHRFDDVGFVAHFAYSFGATPMSSRSNSCVVAWFMSEAPGLAPLRPRGVLGFEPLFDALLIMGEEPPARPSGSGVRRRA